MRSVCVVCAAQATTNRILVSTGWYSLPTSTDVATRSYQQACPLGQYCISGEAKPCPSGRYGNTTALSSVQCSGPCAPGYYCDAGSVNAASHPCGNASVYCPEGSTTPTFATPGQLTIGPTTDTCNGTTLCPASQYCVNGTAMPCPAGRFGCATGLGKADCNGPCAPGFVCPSASDNNHVAPCGNASVYCPEGSSVPRTVGTGNYSIGGPTPEQRSGEAVCPLGSYCVDGTLVSSTGICICR